MTVFIKPPNLPFVTSAVCRSLLDFFRVVDDPSDLKVGLYDNMPRPT